MSYTQQAGDQLHDELVTDQFGALSDAFNGSLFDQLRTLGLALASGKLSRDEEILTIYDWQKAVAEWAKGRITGDDIKQRAADLEEDARAEAQELIYAERF